MYMHIHIKNCKSHKLKILQSVVQIVANIQALINVTQHVHNSTDLHPGYKVTSLTY